MKPLLHVLAYLTLLTQLGFTAPVDEGQVTTFAAGEPAVAAEVNQTLQALITAINDNASRLQALEEQNDPLTALASLSDRISDSKFRLMSLGVGVGNNGTRVTNNVRGSYDTVILNENGTFSGSINETLRESSIDVSVNVGSDPLSSHVTIPEGVNETLDEGFGGAWSLSGQILTLDGDNYFVSLDGNLLISGGQADESLSGGVTLTEVDLVIGVRVVEPIIRVERNSPSPATLANDETFDKSSFIPHTNPIFYTIYNDGKGPLEFTLTEDDPDNKIAVTDPPQTNIVPANGNTTFRVAYTSAETGSGTFIISSNDPDNTPFRHTLTYTAPPAE